MMNSLSKSLVLGQKLGKRAHSGSIHAPRDLILGSSSLLHRCYSDKWNSGSGNNSNSKNENTIIIPNRYVGRASFQGTFLRHPSSLAFSSSYSRDARLFSSAAASPELSDDEEDFFGDFEEKENLHPNSKRALSEVFGIKTMTEIQAKTFDAACSGKDVLGRARTGTGKTLAFLLPAIETVLKHNDSPGSNVGVLVISPTRELAIQIADQANMLLSKHKGGMTCQVMYGGSSRYEDVKRLERQLPTVLVATPGRLQDHLENTTLRGHRFADIMKSKTRVLVLDETDRLLDMGFRKEIQTLVTRLPQQRQTLLFSATMPTEVRKVMAQIMKPDFVTVDCIHDTDPASHTNTQVDQSHIILSHEDGTVKGTVGVINTILQEKCKIICFFPTTNLVQFYAKLFSNEFKQRVIEIHSKKSQSYRTNASEKFRKIKNGILLTSDVSARGVDYPDVTHVLQFGIADSRETYIHRLGRTGRAGKKGKGILVLSEGEKGFLKELKGLDIPVHPENMLCPTTGRFDQLDMVLDSIHSGRNKEMKEAAEKAYTSMLGFYNGQMPSKSDTVKFVNMFAKYCGFQQPPEVGHKAAMAMGMLKMEGIRVSKSSGRGGGNSGYRGGNDRRGGGGGNSGYRGGNDRRGGGRNSY